VIIDMGDDTEHSDCEPTTAFDRQVDAAAVTASDDYMSRSLQQFRETRRQRYKCAGFSTPPSTPPFEDLTVDFVEERQRADLAVRAILDARIFRSLMTKQSSASSTVVADVSTSGQSTVNSRSVHHQYQPTTYFDQSVAASSTEIQQVNQSTSFGPPAGSTDSSQQFRSNFEVSQSATMAPARSSYSQLYQSEVSQSIAMPTAWPSQSLHQSEFNQPVAVASMRPHQQQSTSVDYSQSVAVPSPWLQHQPLQSANFSQSPTND
jgi:hypothetical protein